MSLWLRLNIVMFNLQHNFVDFFQIELKVSILE